MDDLLMVIGPGTSDFPDVPSGDAVECEPHHFKGSFGFGSQECLLKVCGIAHCASLVHVHHSVATALANFLSIRAVEGHMFYVFRA